MPGPKPKAFETPDLDPRKLILFDELAEAAVRGGMEIRAGNLSETEAISALQQGLDEVLAAAGARKPKPQRGAPEKLQKALHRLMVDRIVRSGSTVAAALDPVRADSFAFRNPDGSGTPLPRAPEGLGKHYDSERKRHAETDAYMSYFEERLIWHARRLGAE